MLARESTKLDGPFVCRCGEKHLLHLSKPSGRPEKRPFEPYFAHNATAPHSKRQCLREGGGESELHLEAKALLQKRHGHYYFHIEKCSCGWKLEERLEGGTVHMEHKDEVLSYRYDCYWTDGARQVALEVLHTHACTSEKLKEVQQSGLLLAEFEAKEVKAKLLQLPANGCVLLKNIQEKAVSCTSCTNVRVHKEEFWEWMREVQEIQTQEKLVDDEYCSNCPELFPELYKLTFGKHKGETLEEISMDGFEGAQYLYWMTGYRLDKDNLHMVPFVTDALRLVQERYPQAIVAADHFIKSEYFMRCLVCGDRVDDKWKTFCKSCFSERKQAQQREAQQLQREAEQRQWEAKRQQMEIRQQQREAQQKKYEAMWRKQAEAQAEKRKLEMEQEHLERKLEYQAEEAKNNKLKKEQQAEERRALEEWHVQMSKICQKEELQSSFIQEMYCVLEQEIITLAKQEASIKHAYWCQTDTKYFELQFGRHQGLTLQSLQERLGTIGMQYILCLSLGKYGKASEAASCYLQGKCNCCGKSSRRFNSIANYFRKASDSGEFCSPDCSNQRPVLCDLRGCARCTKSRQLEELKQWALDVIQYDKEVKMQMDARHN